MLPKKKRISQKEADEIFKVGKFLNSPTFSFRFITNKSSLQSKISFIAPKSVAKLAVKRNFLRRKGYLVLKKHEKDFPKGIFGVFIYKKYENKTDVIDREVADIFNKLR